MPTRPTRYTRYVLLVALTMPLLGTGACLSIAQDAIIDGFFDAVTPVLVEQAQEQLGLSTSTDES